MFTIIQVVYKKTDNFIVFIIDLSMSLNVIIMFSLAVQKGLQITFNSHLSRLQTIIAELNFETIYYYFHTLNQILQRSGSYIGLYRMHQCNLF